MPLGRRFRALKLWFVLRTYGAEGLRGYLRHHMRLAAWFARAVGTDPRFEIAAPPRFGLVCFRLKVRGSCVVRSSGLAAPAVFAGVARQAAALWAGVPPFACSHALAPRCLQCPHCVLQQLGTDMRPAECWTLRAWEVAVGVPANRLCLVLQSVKIPASLHLSPSKNAHKLI